MAYKSKHTGKTIDDAIDLVKVSSNPNLLDNWYFGNPVNQRGKTDYSGSTYASKIGLDRWWCRLGSTNTGAVKVESDGLVMDITEPQFFAVVQNIEHSEKLCGRTCTASILVTENTINDSRGGARLTVSYQDIGTANVGTTVGYANYDGIGLYSTTFTFPETLAENQCFKFVISAVNSSNGSTATSGHVKVLAAKLELGSAQTLAHQENGVWVLNEIPNYADELAKCQRYCQVFNYRGSNYAQGYGVANSASNINVSIPLAVQMRTTPTINDTSGRNWTVRSNGSILNCSSVSVWYSSGTSLGLQFTVDGAVASHIAVVNSNSDALIVLSADL